MDRQEAKFVLQACRPNGQDATHPAFAEAVALTESDPELKAWWIAQQEFDRRVAAKLDQILIPSDLRRTILTSRKIEQLTPQPPLLSWLAIAAVVAILCVAGTLKEVAMTTGPMARTEYAASVLPLVHNNLPDLAMTTTDRSKIADWLKARNAPMPTLPAGLSALATIGCQKYSMHGHTVSLICFTTTTGHEAHLFVVDQDAISDPVGSGTEMKQVGSWSTASWSDGQMNYLLVTDAGDDALKQLL